MSSVVRSCYASAALATAVAMTATVSNPVNQGLAQLTMKAGYQSVSMSMVALDALETSTQLQAATVDAVDGTAAAATTIGPSAAATAAATGLPDGVVNVVRFVASAAAAATLPLWWLGFPITFPLGVLIAWTASAPPPGTFDPSGITGVFRFYGSLFAGLLFPTVLVTNFLNAIFPPTPTTPSSAAARLVTRTAAATGASAVSGSSAPSPRRTNQNLSDAVSRATARPAAATSKRSAKSAAANKAKTASAASKRRSAN